MWLSLFLIWGFLEILFLVYYILEYKELVGSIDVLIDNFLFNYL